MNIGLWISFSLSTGRCWRRIVPLAVGGDAPPLRDFGGGG